MSVTTLPLPLNLATADAACNCEPFALSGSDPSGSAMPVTATAHALLGAAPIGFRGRIRAVDATGCGRALPPAELERRLLEMGFVEGATVEIRNQGLFRRDPIAVRVNQATVALRRAEANAIRVERLDEGR